MARLGTLALASVVLLGTAAALWVTTKAVRKIEHKALAGAAVLLVLFLVPLMNMLAMPGAVVGAMSRIASSPFVSRAPQTSGHSSGGRSERMTPEMPAAAASRAKRSAPYARTGFA